MGSGASSTYAINAAPALQQPQFENTITTAGSGRKERFTYPEPAAKSFSAGRKYGEFQRQAIEDTETFLYKLLNATLRNQDLSKVSTLGSFDLLLNSHLVKHSISAPELIVYRGTTLLPGMLEGYQQAIGDPITYHSFTSTSKDFRVAEMYGGNTLFIIRLMQSRYQAHTDISYHSQFPDEQEVLLPAGYQFYVDKIDFDSVRNKHVIYMTG
ncbi:unnamed protein product [Adineta steineri]|uniref:ADP ribosyltransferase domain-containing protein n=1 Tax=Adineta steineri TaxID=433720 RepID=A0A814XFM6_9BILA|nr:unnamed protein product [Adineta steineri]CAF3934378.1 unnamed protein product [Adineta steineri]